MTAVHTVPAVTAALIARGTVTVITAAERGIDGRVLIRADKRHYEPEVPCEWPSGIVVHPGCIVASATVEWVPITGAEVCPPHPHVTMPTRWLWLCAGCKTVGRKRDITDQLPFGDFTPGRWAGILTDVKATTARCPACWGLKGAWGPMGDVWYPCRPCDDSGKCVPIPCDDVKVWP